MSSTASKSLRERFIGIWQYVPGGALLFAVIPLIVLSYLGWFYYGAKHLDQALYALSEDRLTVTPQPAWITTTNVRQAVFQKARLDRISLLDPQANATIAQAFEAHAWVRSTTRVTKSVGGNVAVDVVYRKPIGMVYCQPQPASDLATAPELRKPGFLPVDADGIMLPLEDFTESNVLQYFLVMAENVSPRGHVGMPFGDTRVTEALTLCGFLESEREAQKLERVYVERDRRSSGESPWIMILETADKHQIIWGHKPNAEGIGEPSASDKLAMMLKWLQTQRSSQATAQSLNLMSANGALPVSNSRL